MCKGNATERARAQTRKRQGVGPNRFLNSKLSSSFVVIHPNRATSWMQQKLPLGLSAHVLEYAAAH